MKNIYPEEIGLTATNHELSKQVFEDGMGLKLVYVGNNSRVYRLNENTELNVWTDGKAHALVQAYISFSADKETILKTAKAVEGWKQGVRLSRKKDEAGKLYTFLTINFPDGTDLSLSDKHWRT